MKRLKFQQTKSHTSFAEAYKEERQWHGCWKSFLSALDTVLSGNIVYDFYWWYIWCPIYRVFIGFPKDVVFNLKSRHQRAKVGFAKSDVWGLSDYLEELFYNSFKELIQQIYKESIEKLRNFQPKDWQEFSCGIEYFEPLFKDLDKYILDYEAFKRANEEHLQFVEDHIKNGLSKEGFGEENKRYFEESNKYYHRMLKDLKVIIDKHWGELAS